MTQRMQAQYVQFYISGSTALQIHSEEPKKAAPVEQAKPRTQKRIRICVDPVALLGTAVAVCMLVMMAVGVSQLRTEQQESAAMTEYVQRLEFENRHLQAEYAASCDLEAVEKTALALGMIPQEQATHTVIAVEPPQVQESVTLWNRIGIFLTGLFA